MLNLLENRHDFIRLPIVDELVFISSLDKDDVDEEEEEEEESALIMSGIGDDDTHDSLMLNVDMLEHFSVGFISYFTTNKFLNFVLCSIM